MITTHEYCLRLAELKKRVKERGLNCFLVWARESIYYLTGATFESAERPFFIVVHPDRQPDLLVPMLEREHMMKAPNMGAVHTYFDIPAAPGERWFDRLMQLIAGAQAVGVEPSLPAWCCRQIDSLKPVPLPLVEEMRLVKSPAEVDMVRRSAYYADLCVEKMLSVSVHGGMGIAGYAQSRSVSGRIIQDIGKEWDPLNTSLLMAVWAAPRSAQPHSIPQLEDMLLEGPHVALATCRVAGYTAECERTFFTAEPPPPIKNHFAAMAEARHIAFGMVRPGASCSEIDAAVNEFLSREGYGDKETRLHRTGHGFGLSIHEGPWLALGSDDILAENMLVSIEPGIYLSGTGGLRHSDTVLVTAGGFESLTRFPTSLEELIIKTK